MIAVSAAEMRALDRWTIEHGTPGHVLMERAGTGATRVARTLLGRRRGLVVVVCGRGNNGGDGFVVARQLKRARIPAEVWLTARPEAVQGDAARMLAAWRRARGTVHVLEKADDIAALARRLERATLVVDALFGTGLNAPVTGLSAAVIDAVNASDVPVVAIDIPSGLSADTGQPLGMAIRATATPTFGYAKLGEVLYPGAELSGALHVVDIGIPAAALDAVRPQATLLEDADVGAFLPRRDRNAHKGTFGHVLVVAGSRGKLGAALLATTGALRAGAGLTTLAVPATLQPSAEGRVREAMTAVLPDTGEGAAAPGDGVDELLAGRAAVVCGPGLGRHPDTDRLVAHVVRSVRAPLALDADGLNAVAGTDVLRGRPGPTIVTPHPGEMARLAGTDTATVQGDRVGIARRFAAAQNVVVVLKGARTVIAAPDGRVRVSPTGNPGMATGGTGDVLAGIAGGLLAQGLQPFDAAALAVYAHGAAGDAVAARRGEAGLVAGDLPDELPPTLARLQASAREGRSRAGA